MDGSYCRAVVETDQLFDVIIIDGRDRVNCIKQAINKLSDQGVMILDDSARPWYSEAFEHAKSKGFRVISFEGIKPTGASIYRTSIFYRTDNCLGI